MQKIWHSLNYQEGKMQKVSLNVIILSGRTTAETEMSYTTGGLAVTKFVIAVDGWDSRKRERKTMFMKCVAFDKVAEKTSQYIHKGDFIEVYGRLDENKWVDTERNLHTSYSVVCDKVEFTPTKGKSTQEKTSMVQEPPYYQNPDHQPQPDSQSVSSDPEDIDYVPY